MQKKKLKGMQKWFNNKTHIPNNRKAEIFKKNYCMIYKDECKQYITSNHKS